ncbi:hypothetical protein HF086_013636 [Spodoptera exigua]|uniref:L-type lectin-like domain-containing protein n=1 Tax=Spodoptera exigua TaxID=7107 RepID=A0A922MA00_SPOEX|nr:hypothetical protein HF086_013636 [Spodoptera exigua]
MSSIKINLVLCSVILCVLVCVNTQSVHRRFEYKYSFKPPYLAQKDGSVPFWEYGGNAIASGESVRLAPSLRSQKGAIWSKQPLNFDWWEIDIMFKAFWYTTQRGEYTGEVFGSSDRWNGLAVIFDSFDNDNKHNNPYIMAVLNDGTKVFDHKSDGSQQLLSGCLRDFRNKPFPTRARIEYYLNTLTVYFHNGSGQQMSSDEQQKLSQEYQEYQKKLEQQKEEYRKEHPDEDICRRCAGAGNVRVSGTQLRELHRPTVGGSGTAHSYAVLRYLQRKKRSTSEEVLLKSSVGVARCRH